MGYDQSSHLFYGMEVSIGDMPWWEFTESSDGDVFGYMTGSSATGEMQKYYLVMRPSMRMITEGKYEMTEAISIKQWENELMDQFDSSPMLFVKWDQAIWDYHLKLKLKSQMNHAEWIVGAWGS